VALPGPANSAEVEKIVEARIADVDTGSYTETVTVEFQGGPRPLPVIQMPIDLLSYNPNTHRIRAQRTLDPERDKQLDSDPYGPAAQNYLRDLLMGSPTDPSKTDPSFEALKEDLREHGQNDPGIITRSGVLINGNTRRAALKALGREHIRVAVLPASAGPEDQQEVELALQLRRDHRRDYSFMNLLLAIDERVQGGQDPTSIQKAFRMQAKTYNRNMWILQFVREAIERSKTPGKDGASLSMRLVDFEADKGQLEELYRAWNGLKTKAPDQAESLKEQRLLAMILDKAKTDLRWIEPDFTTKYMKHLISVQSRATAPAVFIPGTSIAAAAPSAELEALRQLTDTALQAKAIEQHPNLAAADVRAKASEDLQTIDLALDDALAKAGKNNRVTKRRLAPVERLSDVADSVDLATAAIAEARATSNFDADDIDDALIQIQRSLAKLAQMVSRGNTSSADRPGLGWLRDAASARQELPA
jgi:hypothetical protein